MKPGTRLRAIAARFCSPLAMERLIDPVIADLQWEHRAAIDRGQRWRSRWIRIAGTFAWLRVLVAYCAWTGTAALMTDNPTRHMLAWCGALIAAVTIIIVAPPPFHMVRLDRFGRAYLPLTAEELVWVVLFLVPGAISSAIPIGVPVGILMGLRNHPVTRTATRGAAAVVIVATVATAFTVNELMPRSNQRFRTLLAHRPLAPGANELRVSALYSRIVALEQAGRIAEAGPFVRSLSFRAILPLTVLTLGLFAIVAWSVVAERRRRIAIGIAVMVAYIWYYLAISPALFWDGSWVRLCAQVMAPNAILALISIAMLRMRQALG
jgi:hypothetical protein